MTDPRPGAVAAGAGTRSGRLSVVHGIPLAREAGLGALTLPGFLTEVTQRYGDREALVEHSAADTVRWSYADLWDRSVQVARALVACGVTPHSRVGVMMTNRPEWLSAAFGVSLAGGVAVLLSTFSTEPELEYMVRASGISVLLFEAQVVRRDFTAVITHLVPDLSSAAGGPLHSPGFPGLRHVVAVHDGPREPATGIDDWPQFLSRGRDVPAAVVEAGAARVDPYDAGALLFSSGTTSRPKGILGSQRAITIQLWRWCRLFALDSDVRCWTPNGFFWSGNFGTALGATLAAGGSLVLQRTFDPAEALELLQRERVDFAQAWPHQWAQIAQLPAWAEADLSSLRYAKAGSAPYRHPSVRRPCRWSVGYGGTETFTVTAAVPADLVPELAAGTVGEPLPGNTIKIIDPSTGEVVPRGQGGEIAVKGPTLMSGYLGVAPEDAFDDEGYFRTGDDGYIDEAGQLHFNGRLSETVKTGGANVSPQEVDEALMTFPGVKMAKTVGIPHSTLGEMVVACVVATAGSDLAEPAIQHFLRQRLASYKVPRRVLFFDDDAFPYTGSNKISLGRLRAEAALRVAAEPGDVPAAARESAQ